MSAWLRLRHGAALFLLLVVAGCAGTPPPRGAPATPPGYAVASANPLATQAGMEILAQGGNAFDAAVAVSAALAVVEPQSSGIGGGGFFLLHREADGFETLVDGRETAPLSATANMYQDARGVADPKASRDGARSAGIPGLPATLAHLAQKYGTKPLATLLAPAARYARDGFPVDRRLAQAIADNVSRLSPDAASIFAPGGVPLAEGATVKQVDLAVTLERLGSDGRATFYDGLYAQAMVSAVKQGGGIWHIEDLRRYKVIERKPLQFFFRDYRITSAPPPSAGGVAMAQAFTMLEARAWPPADAVQAKHQLIEVMRRAFRDRSLLGDPDFVAMPLYRLLSREYLLAQAHTIDPAAATPSATLPPAHEGSSTTHFSILDAQGNRVAGTQTINLGFGSGFMPPGSGVLLNDEMDDFAASMTASNAYGLAGSAANAIAPGKRPLSSMSPTFVEGPRGLLILGTPGGSRIVSMVLLGALGFMQGLDAQQVVTQARFHHQYLPDQVEYEEGALTADEQAGLGALGHTLRPVPSGYGNMQAVWWDRNGDALATGSDPRGIGAGQVKLTRVKPAVPARR